MRIYTIPIVMFILLVTYTASGQTTEFTYQGSLNNGATPANGNYDFEFLLFDAVMGGTQFGSTITRTGVAIADGRFAVNLDFGSQFPGADRYLEIRVRTAGTGAYTILDPRQRVRSAPYSVKSLSATTADNSLNLGGIPANQYVTNPSGSAGFVQNTTVQQPSSNFNISGNGTIGGTLGANMVNSATQYNLTGERILSQPGQNLFVGIGPGTFNTGIENTFVGSAAGYQNTSGNHNSYFGREAGRMNQTGYWNSFFGSQAGFNNTGVQNSFFGAQAGFANTTGIGNSFFGAFAGDANVGGHSNSFFGEASGSGNVSGIENSFFGHEAGVSNTSGSNNTFVGDQAGYNNQTGYWNSFFGSKAGFSNTAVQNSFFGVQAGFANTTGIGNSFFGAFAGDANVGGHSNSFFGEGSGSGNVSGIENSFLGHEAGIFNTNGNNNTFVGAGAGNANTTGSWNTTVGYKAEVGSGALNNATAIGNAAYVTQSNSLVLGAINGINGAGSSTNVGIGTTAPKAKLHIAGGSIFIAQPNSLIITAPNGSCWFITVSNAGTLSTISVACP